MPTDDATTERLEGPTPNGGAYAICYYAHDGQPVARRFANMLRIVEYDAVGQVVYTTFGRTTPEEPLPRTGRRGLWTRMRGLRTRRSADTAAPAETPTPAQNATPAENARRPMSPQEDRDLFGRGDDEAASQSAVSEALRLAWDHVDKQFVRKMEEPHPLVAFAEERQRRGPIAIRMGRAARAKPELARLFPFEVNGQLCLSRCSSYPWTADCPGIGFYERDAEFIFYVFTEPFPEPEGPREEPLVVTADLEVALQTMIRHLPSDQTVWIGSANDR